MTNSLWMPCPYGLQAMVIHSPVPVRYLAKHTKSAKPFSPTLQRVSVHVTESKKMSGSLSTWLISWMDIVGRDTWWMQCSPRCNPKVVLSLLASAGQGVRGRATLNVPYTVRHGSDEVTRGS